MEKYHYTACGIDDVYIEGVKTSVDHEGQETISIPSICRVHREIARQILTQEYKMSGKELRFIRTELGNTIDEMAAILSCRPATIEKWESGEASIKTVSEKLIRCAARPLLRDAKACDEPNISPPVFRPHRTGPMTINRSQIEKSPTNDNSPAVQNAG